MWCAHLVPIYQVAEAEVHEQKRQYERRHDRKREAKQVEQEDFRHFGVVRKGVNIFRVLMAATYESAEEVVDQVVHLQYLRAQTCPAWGEHIRDEKGCLHAEMYNNNNNNNPSDVRF